MEYEGIAIIPILIGISELLKQQGLNGKLIPIINLILGICFGIMVNSNNIVTGVINGIVMALTAGGIYSGSKASWELFR